MVLNPSSSLALLTGKRIVALVSLRDNPNLEANFRTHRQYNNRHEVSKAVWNPQVQWDSYVALASHDKIEVLNVAESSIESMHNLSWHTRTVTDIDWNKGSLQVLASASIDTFVHLWDFRDTRKPCSSLTAMVAPSQVQWSRHKEELLMTSHEGDLKLWDFRNPSLPLQYITAHQSTVLSLDWSYSNPNEIVTCAHDCLLKLIELNEDQKHHLKKRLRTSVPVWRARFTPFGNGLVTVVVPQLEREEYSLFLWTTSTFESPVHCFYGHRDVVLDFGWIKHEDERNIEMLSFGRDQTLRLWRVPTNVRSKCGAPEPANLSSQSSSNDEQNSPHEKVDRPNGVTEQAVEIIPVIQAEEALEVSDVLVEEPAMQTVSPLKEGLTLVLEDQILDSEQSQNSSSRETTPMRLPVNNYFISLQEEFQQLNLRNTKFVRVDNLNWVRRCCKVSASVYDNKVFSRLTLRVSFPPSYPEGKSPTFTFTKGTTLSLTQRGQVLKVLKETSRREVQQNRNCLETCLRQLDLLMDALQRGESIEASFTPLLAQSVSYASEGYLRDSNVPSPRTSGAVFCSNGVLVCFGPSTQQRIASETPRSLSAFSAQIEAERQMEAYRAVRSLTQDSGKVYHTVHSGGSHHHNQQKPSDKMENALRDSLKRQGRFKVRRVRSGSQGEDIAVFKETKSATDGSNTSLDSNSKRKVQVKIYNISRLLILDQNLARRYILRVPRRGSDPYLICLTNSRIAAREGQAEKSHLWQICAQIAKLNKRDSELSPKEIEKTIPWASHPFGRPMLSSILAHLIKMYDFQMAALIACIFRPRGVFRSKKKSDSSRLQLNAEASPSRRQLLQPNQTQSTIDSSRRSLTPVETPHDSGIRTKSNLWFLQPGALSASCFEVTSPYHTVHSSIDLRIGGSFVKSTISRRTPKSDTIHRESPSPLKKKASRSNSWSNPMEDTSPTSTDDSPEGIIRSLSENQYLEPANVILYDDVKKTYGDILQAWGMLQERSQVLKCLTFPSAKTGPLTHIGLEPAMLCPVCPSDSSSSGGVVSFSISCGSCQRRLLQCAVCRITVRGLATRCDECGHGGHYTHWRQWFERKVVCPVQGCGCACISDFKKRVRRKY